MRKAIAVGRKEFRQISRDRRSLLVLLFVPAFFLLLYGYALNFDVQNVALAVHDLDRSTASRALVSSFVNSGYFELVAEVDSPREIDDIIDIGEARAALVVPARFQEDLLSGRRVPVQVIVNGDNSNTATTVMGYAMQVLQAASAQYQLEMTSRQHTQPVSVEPRVWYNPQLRSAIFLIPGLIAYIGMISAVISTALSVVREKERGTMEQIRMAPLGASTYIAGKTLPYFAILAGHVRLRGPRINGALRSAHERLVAAAAAVAFAVPRWCAGVGTHGLQHRRVAASGVSGGRAGVVSADDDALGVCVSHCEHADRHPGRHVSRSRQIFHRGTTSHPA